MSTSEQSSDAGDTSASAPGADLGVLPVGTISFDTFFSTQHASITRALTLALGDVELGRDAASEGFVRALKRWDAVAGYDNPAGWVYRVGLNWARSRRRKTLREVAQRPTDTPVSALEPDPAVLTALRQLSLEHRSVVVGRYYFDWSEAQLAAALDIAPGTVKSRLSRGLDRLEQLLGSRP